MNTAKLLQQDLLNLAMWCAKWRIKLNPEKNKAIIFSRSVLARKTEPNAKLYGETLNVYHQVKFLGITFDSQLTFQKHSEDILDCSNIKYHRLKLLVNHIPQSKSTKNASDLFLSTALFRRLPPQTTSSAEFNGSKTNLFATAWLRWPSICKG